MEGTTSLTESLFFIIITLFISSSLIFLFNLFFQKNKKLPPGPYTFSVIRSLSILLGDKFFADIEVYLQELKCKYGPIITLKIGTSTNILFISSHSLAYEALVQKGALCSDRPNALPTNEILNSNDRTINTASYGPTWRLLRRNLKSEMLHPSLIKSLSKSRAWALSILIQKINTSSKHSSSVEVTLFDHMKYAIFSLLVFMCFGEKLNEAQIKQIQDVQHQALLAVIRFKILDFFPRVIGKLIFRNSWKELIELRKKLESVFIPLIQARIKYNEEKVKAGVVHHGEEDEVVTYVDTLVNMELPEEKRKLTYEEMVSLCGEFLGAASDTTSTALQWIMAYLVKYPSIQEKLYNEICEVVGTPQSRQSKVTEEGVKEEDLQKMPYLKAVILEGLRRHPPSHFSLPHRVREDMELNGYVIPKNAIIHFMVREMGLDPKVWEDPMEFKPERFLMERDGESFDITGSRVIKMMPFGVGRRICPGYDFAMLHLEYFVANLIWHFDWKAIKGEEIDLTEELDFTFTMKYPLRAHVCPRVNSL